jgi:hypothetical protein
VADPIEGAVDAGENAVKGVGHGLGHKVGPLPVWAWVVVGGVVVGGGYLLLKSHGGGASPSASNLLGALPPTGGASGGNGLPGMIGGGTVAATGTSATPYASNSAWLSSVASQVAAATQLPLNEVQLYLSEYLGGNQPIGSGSATSQFDKVVAAALGIGAPPNSPSIPQPGQTGYYTNATWLNDVLSFLPAGTSQSVQQEIIALANGTSSTLSQDAANALAAAQSVVGVGPTPLTYKVGTTPSPAPSPTWSAPTITQNLVDQLVAAYQGASQKSGGAVSSDTQYSFWSSILGIPKGAAQYVVTQSDAYTASTGLRSTATQIQSWVNQAHGQGLT